MTFLLALPAISVQAASPPSIEQALEDWSGQRRVLLRSDQDDPLSSPLVQELLADLMGRGFKVTPAPLDAAAETGLVLDLRTTGTTPVLVLSQAEDGTIIAFEKRGPNTERRAETAPKTVPVHAPPEQARKPSHRLNCLPPGLNELSGEPRAVAVLDNDGGQCDLLVLYDDNLALLRGTASALMQVASFESPVQPSRALYLGAGDIDGDGSREIAAVWAEDEKTIYEGVDTQPHSWILHFSDGAFHPASPDLEAYLRISADTGYLQRRGRQAPFAGPVFRLVPSAEGFKRGEPVAWPVDAGIYAATPLGNNQALTVTDEFRPAILSLGVEPAGAPSYLPETLGNFQGPEVAIRRPETEYRLGLEKEGQVNTDYHRLPRPVIVSGKGAAYTIRRGRKARLPLISEPSGRDEVVRIATGSKNPAVTAPFAGVSAFILDFALLHTGDSPSAILLLNETPSGDGAAYLIWQAPQGI